MIINSYIFASSGPPPTGDNILQDPTFIEGGVFWALHPSCNFGTNEVDYDDTANGYIGQSDTNNLESFKVNTQYRVLVDLSGATGNIIFSITNYFEDTVYEPVSAYSNGTDVEITFTTPSDIAAGGISLNPQDASDSGWTLQNFRCYEVL